MPKEVHIAQVFGRYNTMDKPPETFEGLKAESAAKDVLIADLQRKLAALMPRPLSEDELSAEQPVVDDDETDDTEDDDAA